MTPQDPTDLTVACYVRAPLLLDPVDAKIRTLQRCDREDRLGDLVMRSWSDSVALSGDGPDQEARDRFERFEQWAEDHGVTVRPPFRVETRTSTASDEQRRVLVTPVLCLALYDEEELLAVYPHSDGDATYTAPDAIADLSTGDVPSVLGDAADRGRAAEASAPGIDGDEPAAPEPNTDLASTGAAGQSMRVDRQTPTTCPDCAESLVNVQGIPACPTCGWEFGQVLSVETTVARRLCLSLVDGATGIDALRSSLSADATTVDAELESLREAGIVERRDADTVALAESTRQRATAPSSVPGE